MSKPSAPHKVPPVFVLWPDENRERVLSNLLYELRMLPSNVPWRVSIEQWERKASTGQKARFHVLIGQLAKQMGDDPRSVKEMVKARIGLTDTVLGVDGKDVELPRSITDYKGTELDALCERLIVLAAEFGYELT